MPPTPRKRTSPRGRRAGPPRRPDLTAPPASIRIAEFTGAALGLWLTSDGLWARLFGVYLFPAGWHSLWKAWPAVGASDPNDVGWLLVVLGASWAGALIGLGMGRRWAFRAALALSLAALPTLGLGSALAAVVLVCILAPASRAWIRQREGDA